MRLNKKALLVVSFGTTFPDAISAIENIEEEFKQTFPEYDFYRVFTSGMIIRKLKRTKGIEILDMEKALDYLYQEGYTEVICQPTHIINGMEYEKVKTAAAPYRKLFRKFILGEPLLTTEQNFRDTAEILLAQMPEYKEDEAVVFMGHGSAHYANGAYSEMENMFRALGREQVYVGTVEGFPGLSYIEGRLKKKGIRKVHLMLMMIVAGDHAQNDLAGEEDSWKAYLLEQGYEVSTSIIGMGLLDGIPKLYTKQMKKRLLLSE
ncbi:MAG: sirohydrochlorin cobaltochelatase [Lachnospiraceae bacterium]|nr:sirohydrochlorin cobaltochelatase [Lachnospiraceae bacterium]